MIGTAPVPSPLTATYRVSANGGNDFPGTTFATEPPFIGPWFGNERIVKGPANFGGGISFSGGGAIQIGVQFFYGSHGTPPPTNYGETPYANGYAPFDLLRVGTDAKGISILSPLSIVSSTTFPNGLVMRRHNGTFAARTPGGTTKDQHGAIRTVGGETPRLQLVTPWAAAVQTHGPFGLSAVLPEQGFGGVAVLRIDIIPIPEPGGSFSSALECYA